MRKSKDKKKLDTVGDRIRFLRGDLTQAEFADLMMIRQAMVSRYESNLEIPSSKGLLKLARFTGKSMEWILTGHDSLQPPSSKKMAKEGLTIKKSNMKKKELIEIAFQHLLATRDPNARELAEMIKSLFKRPKIMKEVISYYQYLLINEKSDEKR